jgi:hypothetical protein
LVGWQPDGGDAGIFDLLVGHIDGMANDIGQLEILGPNPGATAGPTSRAWLGIAADVAGHACPRPHAAPDQVPVMSAAAHPVWPWPGNRGGLYFRLRSSEAQRRRHGSLAPPPALVNMGRVAPVRHLRCQYIAGDPRQDATMCGAPVAKGLSWCSTCSARVFVQPVEVPSA